eukprot:COSAG05_NODE_2113_length_3545_cov_82.901335_3_plen_57_part_00
MRIHAGIKPHIRASYAPHRCLLAEIGHVRAGVAPRHRHDTIVGRAVQGVCSLRVID